MDDETKKLIPDGVVMRLIKPSLTSKGCRVSPEYTKALNKYLVKMAVEYTIQACEVTLAKNKKTLDVEALRAVGDKNGFLIE